MPDLPFQIIEFDLKGTPLDSSSFIDVVVKDYETIGKDKYVCIYHCFISSVLKDKIFLYIPSGGVGGCLPSGCGGVPCNHFTHAIYCIHI